MAIHRNTLGAPVVTPDSKSFDEKHDSSCHYASYKGINGHDDQLGQIDEMKVLAKTVRLIIQPSPLGVQVRQRRNVVVSAPVKIRSEDHHNCDWDSCCHNEGRQVNQQLLQPVSSQ